MKLNEYLWGLEWKGHGVSSAKYVWAESFEQAYILAKAETKPNEVLVGVKLLDSHAEIYLHNCGL